MLRSSILIFVLFLSAGYCQAELKYVGTNQSTGFSDAVIVNGASLVQTSQIFPDMKSKKELSESQQFDLILHQAQTILKRSGSSLAHLVKLNIYVTDDSVAETVKNEWKQKQTLYSLPAVCFVTTALPVKGADIAVDFLAKSFDPVSQKDVNRKQINISEATPVLSSVQYPSERMVYISGQAEKGTLAEATTKTLESLHKSLKWMSLDASHVVQLKLFMKPMSDSAVVYQQVREFYKKLGVQTLPAVSFVEWTNGLPIEIEMVAVYPEENELLSKSSAQFLTVPGMTSSPVYCRVAVTHSKKLVYLSGFYSKKELSGKGEQELRNLYSRLEKALNSVGSSLDYMIKATYYVSDAKTSSAFTPVRMELYNHLRPPAASKASVKGVGNKDHTVTIDMIAIGKD